LDGAITDPDTFLRVEKQELEKILLKTTIKLKQSIEDFSVKGK